MTELIRKKLLIVEDDETLLGVMQRALRKRGYEVECASAIAGAHNVIEALECRQQHIALAVVDLKLTDETSLALLPYLRRHNPDMKIIVLTGYASIATAVEAVKLGADNYLPKPATVNEILQALEETKSSREHENNEAETLSPMSTKRLEWEYIQRALQKNKGNISATARELNMHRRTLQRKLQKRPVKG